MKTYHQTGHSYAQACAERDDRYPLRVGYACRFYINARKRIGYVVEMDADQVTIAYRQGDDHAFLTYRETRHVKGLTKGSMIGRIPADLRERVERRLAKRVAA